MKPFPWTTWVRHDPSTLGRLASEIAFVTHSYSMLRPASGGLDARSPQLIPVGPEPAWVQLEGCGNGSRPA